MESFPKKWKKCFLWGVPILLALVFSSLVFLSFCLKRAERNVRQEAYYLLGRLHDSQKRYRDLSGKFAARLDALDPFNLAWWKTQAPHFDFSMTAEKGGEAYQIRAVRNRKGLYQPSYAIILDQKGEMTVNDR